MVGPMWRGRPLDLNFSPDDFLDGEKPSVWYHGTEACRVDAILREGLRPVVFVAAVDQMAAKWGQIKAGPGGDFAVFRVEIDPGLVAATRTTWGWIYGRVAERIPPEWISIFEP